MKRVTRVTSGCITGQYQLEWDDEGQGYVEVYNEEGKTGNAMAKTADTEVSRVWLEARGYVGGSR